MTGEHAYRLERLEKRVDELHQKRDEFAEAENENSTDIVWLKWTVRELVASAAGVRWRRLVRS